MYTAPGLLPPPFHLPPTYFEGKQCLPPRYSSTIYIESAFPRPFKPFCDSEQFFASNQDVRSLVSSSKGALPTVLPPAPRRLRAAWSRCPNIDLQSEESQDASDLHNRDMCTPARYDARLRPCRHGLLVPSYSLEVSICSTEAFPEAFPVTEMHARQIS